MILCVDVFRETFSQHLSLVGHRDTKSHPEGSCNSHWPEELSLFHGKVLFSLGSFMTTAVQAYKSLSVFQSNTKNFKGSRITDWDLPRTRRFIEQDEWQTRWTGWVKSSGRVSDVFSGSWTCCLFWSGRRGHIITVSRSDALCYYHQHLLMAQMSYSDFSGDQTDNDDRADSQSFLLQQGWPCCLLSSLYSTEKSY